MCVYLVIKLVFMSCFINGILCMRGFGVYTLFYMWNIQDCFSFSYMYKTFVNVIHIKQHCISTVFSYVVF